MFSLRFQITIWSYDSRGWHTMIRYCRRKLRTVYELLRRLKSKKRSITIIRARLILLLRSIGSGLYYFSYTTLTTRNSVSKSHRERLLYACYFFYNTIVDGHYFLLFFVFRVPTPGMLVKYFRRRSSVCMKY